MAESAEEFFARATSVLGDPDRAPAGVEDQEIFPWEVVDGRLVAKQLQPPIPEEAVRHGEGGQGCTFCTGLDSVRIWESWNFHVARPAAPSGLPLVLYLNANEHYDFHEMSDEEAAEFGQLTVWLNRIMGHLPGVGRVHVQRWGDGAEHMHVWFAARPERIPGILGSMAIHWDEILPPVPEDIWLQDCRTVATKLANHGGRALV